MEAKRKIHKFNFDEPTMMSGAKTHVALVDKAANLTTVLTMKSKVVRNSQTVDEYSEDGTSIHTSDTQTIRDHDGEYLYVTDEKVRIVETMIKIR